MHKKIILLATASLITLAGSLQAQTTLPGLSADFELTGMTLDIPPEMLESTGYPRWRLLTMNGQNAVPYNYCSWLIAQKPWVTEVFGDSSWQAVVNCAQGISQVTQREVDGALPVGSGTAAFWRNRPVGYQYLVPDYNLTEAQFLELMDVTEPSELTFVSDPQLLGDYLDEQLGRIQALEDWRQSLADDGGVVTQDALEAWAIEQEYVRREDLPEGGELSESEVQGLIDAAIANLPAGFTEADARALFVLSETLPADILTQSEADERYQAKGDGVVTGSFVYTFWWLVLMLALLLSVVGLALSGFLYRKVDTQEKAISHEKTGLVATNTLAATATSLAGNAMQTAKTATQLGLPAGWESVSDWPTQAVLDDLAEGATVSMRFVHDDSTEHQVVFTALDKAFPQNEGKRQKGLLVSGQATSAKPVARRVGMLIRECCKALHDREKPAIQPRDGKGKFVAVSAPKAVS